MTAELVSHLQDWGGGLDHPAQGFRWTVKFNLCGMGLWAMMCCQE